MEIGIQSEPIFKALGAEKTFAIIRESGFTHVDFGMDTYYGYEDIISGKTTSVYDGTEEEILELYRPIKEAAEENGIRFSQAHAPFPTYIGNPSTDAYVLKVIRQCIMVCSYLGCPYLIVHPAVTERSAKGALARERETNMALYRALIPDLKKYKVGCCLENMFTYTRKTLVGACCSDPDEAITYIDALNAEAGETLFGFCLDVGHSLLTAEDIGRFIHLLGERLVTLHIHDNNGITDQHIAPYMGDVDWPRFCAAIKESGYKGVLSFESGGAPARYPQELWPALYKLMAATGKLFSDWIGA